MQSAQHQNTFNPYIAEFRSDLERILHEDLFSKFSEIEPETRPWYGVGLALEASGSAAKSLGFLIVPPTHIVLAHLFSVPNVSTGIVHGDSTLKEWRIETDDARLLKMGETHSPFAHAREALHFFLPKLDSFLHARKVKNPYVQCLLVFPDGYSFAGVQEVPIGPNNRGAITLVKLSEVSQVALSGRQDQKLDRAIFREWIQTLLGTDDETTFGFTWFDPAPRKIPMNGAERQATAAASVQNSIAEQEVITLTRETNWSFDDRSDRGPIEFTPEEVTLLKAKRVSLASQQQRSTGTSKIARRFLKIAGSTVLILLILFIAHEVYMYFKPPFPLTPYWQETTPPQSDQISSGNTQSGKPGATQAPPSASESPAPVTPDATAARESPTAVQQESNPLPEKNPAQVLPPPSPAATSQRPNPVDRRFETDLQLNPAPLGIYETIRSTRALEQPLDSAPVVDPIPPRTRLNVVGSDGAWLIVHSRTRNRTVYVKRDAAALISARAAQPRAAENTELKWKEIELQIREAILQRGVPNITVTFIGDTAYLRGTVRNPQESELAELGAKTIPEVKYVHNGIWVNR